MISGGWVCALHVRTGGLGGAALGSDEEETVYLAYIVIDVLTNQVRKNAHLKYLLVYLKKLRPKNKEFGRSYAGRTRFSLNKYVTYYELPLFRKLFNSFHNNNVWLKYT